MNINLNIPTNRLSYGYCGCYINQELQKLANVSLFPIGGNQSIQQAEIKFKDSLVQGLKNALMFDYEAPSIRIFHQFSLAESYGKGPRIGFPIFELNKFNDLEKHHLNSCDYLFVCSQWAKQVVEENGIRVPTFVVPLGVDLDTFVPTFKPESKKKIFLIAGKWEVRKSQYEVMKAFKKVFRPDEAELWCMCDNPFFTEEQCRYWTDELSSNMRIIPRVDTHDQVARIMSKVDFGIFVSKAEGWNLELNEMLAMGKKCIATNYSGHTEYINDKNCVILESKGMQTAYDGVWFKGYGEWCQFDFDELCDGLKLLYNSEPIQPLKDFTWKRTAQVIMNCLEQL